MTKLDEARTKGSPTGAIKLLQEHKDRASREVEKKALPASKVPVTIPGFIDHGLWMNAQRQAKGDAPKAQMAFVSEVVRFGAGDEKLTVADLRALLDAKDLMFLTAAIFGDEDEGEDQAAA